MLKRFLSRYDKVSLIVAFIAVNNVIAITFNLGMPYYLIMFAAFLYLIRSEAPVPTSNIGIIFLLCCVLSIVANDVPSFFNPWMRLATFIIMVLLIGPFVRSNTLDMMRINVFNLIQLLIQPIVFCSFGLYLVGIHAVGGGWVGFAGITTHTMILAPVCGIAFSQALYQIFKGNYSGKYARWYWIVLAVISFLSVLLTASRMTLIGSIGILLVFVIYKFRDDFATFLKWFVCIAIVIAATQSYWMPYTEPLQEKNAGSMRDGGMTSSRDVHWTQRISEFEQSPFVGVGFSAVDIDSEDGSNFDASSGRVESGSSWLSVLSMIGAFGFILLVSFFIRAIKEVKIISQHHEMLALLLMSQMVFWMLHMIAEGYILSAGGFLFFNVWLLLGTIDAYSKQI